jgi:hypothetical protein
MGGGGEGRGGLALAEMPPPEQRRDPHKSRCSLGARFGTRDSGGVVSFSCCDGLVYLLGYTDSV